MKVEIGGIAAALLASRDHTHPAQPVMLLHFALYCTGGIQPLHHQRSFATDVTHECIQSDKLFDRHELQPL